MHGLFGLHFSHKTAKKAVNLQLIARSGLLAVIACIAIYFSYEAYLSQCFHSRMQDVNAIMAAKYGPDWQYRSEMAKDLQAAFKKF